MYVQIIQGKLADAELQQRALDRWSQEIKPGATGYLGRTSGNTADGRTIALVRFDSQEAAEANSARPEQGAWWNEMAKSFDGEPTFHNCSEVDSLFGGGSNDAGFVQIIQGRAKDQAAMRSMMTEMEAELREQRPDILGIAVCWHGDGGFTQAVYFRTEAEARAAESAPDNQEAGQEFMDLFDGPPTFFDLTEPQFD